jgi:hypothetical protein
MTVDHLRMLHAKGKYWNLFILTNRLCQPKLRANLISFSNSFHF